MASDDLNQPLGLNRTPRRRLPYRFAAVSALGLALLGGFAYLYVRGDPLGGEPHIVAVITHSAPPVPAPAAAKETPSVDPLPTGTIVAGTASVGTSSAVTVEQKSGVTVVRSGGGMPPGAEIIDVPQLLAQRLAAAPDPRLIEASRYGLLPRIGKDGTRSADVYARPFSASDKPNAPRIALIVGGVGLSDSATAQAIQSLPGPVTLAFAPYGSDLKSKVQQAREAGHEVILQLPMEPIDYPRLNPGPHTLLAAASATQNAEDLHWLLARFTGYTGVANFLGAKLTGTPASLQPVLREIAARGLFYLDDGSSPQSAALALAKDVDLPARGVDIILDGSSTESMTARLVKLEAIARQKGIAIGMASDLPVSLENLARFAQTANAHGLVLIPLSAAFGNGQPVSATSAP